MPIVIFIGETLKGFHVFRGKTNATVVRARQKDTFRAVHIS